MLPQKNPCKKCDFKCSIESLQCFKCGHVSFAQFKNRIKRYLSVVMYKNYVSRIRVKIGFMLQGYWLKLMCRYCDYSSALSYNKTKKKFTFILRISHKLLTK